MDANSLINAMIANLVDNRDNPHSADWNAGAFDAIAHAISVVRNISEDAAGEELSEEIQERIAAQA